MSVVVCLRGLLTLWQRAINFMASFCQRFNFLSMRELLENRGGRGAGNGVNFIWVVSILSLFVAVIILTGGWRTKVNEGQQPLKNFICGDCGLA